MYAWLELFGLVFGALETDVKVQFLVMSRIYHTDKQKTGHTGMTGEYETKLFQIFKNSHYYLREVL